MIAITARVLLFYFASDIRAFIIQLRTGVCNADVYRNDDGEITRMNIYDNLGAVVSNLCVSAILYSVVLSFLSVYYTHRIVTICAKQRETGARWGTSVSHLLTLLAFAVSEVLILAHWGQRDLFSYWEAVALYWFVLLPSQVFIYIDWNFQKCEAHASRNDNVAPPQEGGTAVPLQEGGAPPQEVATPAA